MFDGCWLVEDENTEERSIVETFFWCIFIINYYIYKKLCYNTVFAGLWTEW